MKLKSQRGSAVVGVPLIIFGVLLFLAWSGLRIVEGIRFDRNCEGHLKRAADANTIELAESELKVAIGYLDSNKMTTGYTSVLWTTPDEDLEFWHKNLKQSLEELEKTSPQATPLEKSNMLLKLRETLLDHKQDGEKVTSPDGISIFPNNATYFWWFWVSLAIMLVGALFLLA